MSWNKKYLTSSILLALAMPAVAADTNSRAKVNETVVVSASRSEQLLKDVAGSVSVITADDIEANLVKDIGEIFDYTPGVTVESDSRYGVQSVNIRGMEGNRVKIVVDGVSQANRFDSGASFIQSGRLNIDPGMLKSAEVVKGAASSLYGSDAIGGIVSFNTKDPSDFIIEGDDTGGHAKLSYSSVDNSFAQSVALANRSGKLESLVVYTHRLGDEEKDFGESDSQDNNSDNVLVKLQYEINETNRIEFTGENVFSETDTDIGIPDKSYWVKSNGASDENQRQRLGVKYILTDSNFAFDSMSLQFDWQKSEQKSESRGVKGNRDSEVKKYGYKENGYEFSSQFNKQFLLSGIENNLVYGLSYAARDIENVNMTYITDTSGNESTKLYFYMPAAEDSKFGAYLQDQIVLLGGDLTLTPGVRFDRFETKPDNTPPSGSNSGYEPTTYSDHSDSAATGRLGAVYSLNDDMNIFAQVSQGFRAPDFQELYYSYSNSAHGYKNVSNPNLKAETSITYETGLRGDFDAGSYELAVFYSDYDDFIDQVTDKNQAGFPAGVTTYDNLDKAKIKGVELGSQLFLGAFTSSLEGSSLQFAAAYTDGEDQDGKALNSVAPWSAVVGLGYDNVDATWGTSLKTVFTARKSSSDINSTDTGTQNQIENPSSTVVDLTAYYKPLPDLTLRAGVYNLTDTKYWAWNDVRGLTAQDDDLSQPERNYSVTVKYEF